jgi:tellurite resistance protein
MKNLIQGILQGVLFMELADGELHPDEKDLIQVIAERFDLTEEELAEAIGDARSLSVDDIRQSLDHDDRKTVVQYAVMAAYADGNMDAKEEDFLHTLEKRLGMNAKDVRELEELGRELAKAAKKRPIDLEELNEIVESFVG